MKKLDTLEFEREGRIAIIHLNRPDAANAFNYQLSSELYYVAKICDNDPDIKAVVLTGKGRFFSAGGDVKEMASFGDEVGVSMKRNADEFHNAISTFARMKAPLIIAVNGLAAGAGFSLSISGDIVLASSTSEFLMAYTKAGLSPDGSSSYYVPRLIGLRRAQELMLTNRQLSADEALDWGLITEVVEPEQLMDRAMVMANMLAEGSLGANAAVKKLLLCTFDNGLETQMELEGREICERAKSPDGQEGFAAFAARRKPEFL